MTLSENPLGCSPRVLDELKTIKPADISQYPDTTPLIRAISTKFKILPDQIILGNGSEQLIKLIAQIFLNKGDRVLVQKGSFPLFTRECLLAGSTVNFFEPGKALNQKPKMIFVCNPNNPTGKILPLNIIKDISKKFSSSILIVDEANGEFLKQSAIKSINELPNCVILRTFSKALGLAGLRIGFAIGSINLMQTLNTSQQVFPVSAISCKLALSALRDQTFLKKTLKFVGKERSFLAKELVRRDLKVSNSVTSNLFIEIAKAKQIINLLKKNGVSVVDGSFFPAIDKPGFRISIRDKKTNRQFLKKLDEALACEDNKKLLASKETL